MEDRPLSRAYLESLTTDELVETADNLGMDVPDDPDRLSIIEELLEIASGEPGDTSSEKETSNSVLSDFYLLESVPLPKQYNITFINVMIRDPLWAFVFWEIKAQDKEQFEKAPDFTGYYLKVSPMPASKEKNSLQASGRIESDKVFSVSVSPNDTAWYLGLSPTAAEETSSQEQIYYKVELCAGFGYKIEDETEMVLAVSAPVRLPGLPEMPRAPLKGENPLVRLSGYGDFRIIRRNERPPRVKRGESAGSNE